MLSNHWNTGRRIYLIGAYWVDGRTCGVYSSDEYAETYSFTGSPVGIRHWWNDASDTDLFQTGSYWTDSTNCGIYHADYNGPPCLINI